MKKLHEHLVRDHKWYANWHENSMHQRMHWYIFVLVGILVANGLLYYSTNIINASQPILSQVIKEKKDPLLKNNKLLSLSYQYQQAKTEEAKQALLAQLTDIASQRKSDLLDTMKKKPKSFKQIAFPQAIRKNLPVEISSLLETEATIEGKFSVFHKDDFENPANDIWDYMIKTKEGKVYHLNSDNNVPLPRSGATVKVTGTVLDQQIMLAAPGSTTTSSIETVVAAPLPKSPLGEQKTAVIIYTTTGSSIYTASQMQNLFFAEPSVNPISVNAFFKEGSFGQTWFTGTVFGPYTIPGPVNGVCADFGNTLNQKVLDATGVDVVAQYPRIVYASDSASCGDGVAGLDSVAQVSGSTNSKLLGVAYHELGHVLGINHGNSLTCGGKQVDLFSNCNDTEYGDRYTSMGGLGTSYYYGITPQFNAEEKRTLSWIPQSKVQDITTSGTYTVYASETSQTGPQVLSIYKPDFNRYSSDGSIYSKGYLSFSFRKAFGFDLSLSTNVTSGVTAHVNRRLNTTSDTYSSNDSYTRYTYILDTTPADSDSIDNKAILDGMTFTDNVIGVSVKQLSHTTNSATVQVTFLPSQSCTRGQTTLDISPITANTTNIVAGETRALSFIAQNNDTANCSPSNFTFGANVPTGWSVIPSTVLIPALGAGVGTVYITTPATLATGTYNVNYKTSDISTTLHNALSATNAIYVQSSDTLAPTVHILAPANGGIASGTASQFSVSAYDNPTINGSGMAKVEFYRGTALVGTKTISPYSITWDTTTTPNGVYALTAKAYDVAGNSATSTPVSVTVANAGSNTDTTKPVATFISPASGATVSGNTSIIATATDNTAVTKMELYLDNVMVLSRLASTNITYRWSTTTATNSTHTAYTKAYDAAGNVGTSPVSTFTVNNNVDPTPPTVSISTPANGSTISDTTTISATATDNVGVTKVDFYKDTDTTPFATDTTSPFTSDLNTINIYNGSHTLYAKAYDMAGNIGTSSVITINVYNSPVPPTDGGSDNNLTNTCHQYCDGSGLGASASSVDTSDSCFNDCMANGGPGGLNPQ